MRIILYLNPRSGKGAARKHAAIFERELLAIGASVEIFEAGKDPPVNADALRGADALVVVGGDGTLHWVADAAIAAGVPIYHAPLGTENLFARHFGMDLRPRTLIEALRRARVSMVDAASCNGRTYLLMASIGPDAAIIHRLAETRSGTITHLSYVRPILAELLRPIAPLTVHLDGTTLVTNEPGWLVVANSRQYALRIDPCREALIDDGLLDLVFFPASAAWKTASSALTARLRFARAERSIHRQGHTVSIEAPASARLQLDGEAVMHDGRIEMHMRKAALKVLLTA